MSTSPQSHSANTAVPSARLIPIILRLAGLFVLILALLFAWLHWWWGLALLILLFIGCLLLFSWLLVRLGYSSIKTKNRGTLPLPMAGHNNGKWNDRRPHDSS